MSKTRDKLARLDSAIKKNWNDIKDQKNISTREKLEKLVNSSLRKKTEPEISTPESVSDPILVRDYTFGLNESFGPVCLEQWKQIQSEDLAVLFGDSLGCRVDPMKLLYFDTETTGLSGGTGTIPFMLGFGFFAGNEFRVKIFMLMDLSGEGEFLDRIDAFLSSGDFAATVTYNGKCFDFPLMETRYILQRKRFPLLKQPHLDFLYPARVVWRNTYASRKLGYLGEILLGIDRQDDVDGSLIPDLYFRFLRSRDLGVLEQVIEHNSLDLVGLAALMLLSATYVKDPLCAGDEGEVAGVARLYENSGHWERAAEILDRLRGSAEREEIVFLATRRLAQIRKKKKLYSEAGELWQQMALTGDSRALRELSIHYEHREKDLEKALATVQGALEDAELSFSQRMDMEKRLHRLTRKIRKLTKE